MVYGIRAQSKGAEAAALAAEEAGKEAQNKALGYYLQALELRAQRRALEEYAQNLAARHNEIQRLYELGGVGESELLKVKLGVDDAHAGARELKEKERLLGGLLAQSLGQEGILSPSDLPSDLPSAELPAAAPEARADLKALELQAEAADAAAAGAESGFLPKVNASVSYLRADQELLNQQDWVAVGATATWTLFDGAVRQAKEKAAEHEAAALREKRRSAVLGLRAQIGRRAGHAGAQAGGIRRAPAGRGRGPARRGPRVRAAAPRQGHGEQPGRRRGRAQGQEREGGPIQGAVVGAMVPGPDGVRQRSEPAMRRRNGERTMGAGKLFLAAAFLAASMAQGLRAESAERPAFGVGMGAGLDSVALGDINAQGGQPVHQGEDLDLRLNWRPLDWLAFSFSSGYLQPTVRQSDRQFYYYNPLAGGALSAWPYTQRERVPALENLVQAWMVRPWGPLDLRIGVGGGIASLAGAMLSSDAYGSQPLLLYGSAPVFRAGLGLDWWVDSHFSLGLEGGYRACVVRQVTEAESGSGTLKNADGSNTAVDFSGFERGAGRGVLVLSIAPQGHQAKRGPGSNGPRLTRG